MSYKYYKYGINHFNFVDKIVTKKRREMLNLINSNFKDYNFFDVLDIGTTIDMEHESSNFIVKNLKNIQVYKSISDQKIQSDFFSKTLNKSITDNLSEKEINDFKCDLVISNATIEHVGNFENQRKMILNIINLAKKAFVISTPNRYHPIDFHTKFPLIHWFPKNIHRKILSYLGLSYLAKEENLNLLSEKDLESLFKINNFFKYKTFYIKLLFFKSNFIVIGIK
tara:strand:- start:1634 stop:2308 length:675 start_codon:yes stop_codon:yes gene_type:complete